MVSFEDFKKLDIRVAKVLEARDHPNADKLLLLKINAGGREKQIVAGIKKFYQKEELTGKQIVIIDNLAPATIRGEVSEGMLLAAQSDEMISVLVPDKEIKDGSQVK
ncbi:MAG: methionine--tRNA ligase subunit beta [Candidatus Omnitrophica bacterium]|nr:methionine--tRNA ligase subunit beta [Candidatus Omnitrophota bacterium]